MKKWEGVIKVVMGLVVCCIQLTLEMEKDDGWINLLYSTAIQKDEEEEEEEKAEED